MTMKTLYGLADEEIRICIAEYLTLAEESTGLTNIRAGHLVDKT
jgi:hypothetical protein